MRLVVRFGVCVLSQKLRVLEVPDVAAANVLSINGTVVCRAASEYSESAKIFRGLGIPVVEVRRLRGRSRAMQP